MAQVDAARTTGVTAGSPMNLGRTAEPLPQPSSSPAPWAFQYFGA
jgi:hypothetical protein